MTKRTLQRTTLAVFAAVFVMASLAPVLASQSGDEFHWGRKRTPFTLQIGDNLNNGWDKRTRRAISEWNENDTIVLKEVGGSTNPKTCSQSKGMVEVCNGLYGTQVQWLGLTRLFFDKDREHIEAATVQMNDSFFDQRNGQYNSEAARQHTICHELGHALGLGHVNTKSCMNDSQSAVFNNLLPINKDFRQLARIYDHRDSSTTVSGNQKSRDSGKRSDRKNGAKDAKKADRQRDRKNEARERRRELKRRNSDRVGAASIFDPAVLPGVAGGNASNETVTVETLDDGTTVVSFITWAEE